MKKYNAMWATNCKQGNWVLCLCYRWSVLILWEVRGVWWELCLKVTKYRARSGRPVAWAASKTVMIQFRRSYCYAAVRPGLSATHLGRANIKFSILNCSVNHPVQSSYYLVFYFDSVLCFISWLSTSSVGHLTIDMAGNVKYETDRQTGDGDWGVLVKCTISDCSWTKDHLPR